MHLHRHPTLHWFRLSNFHDRDRPERLEAPARRCARPESSRGWDSTRTTDLNIKSISSCDGYLRVYQIDPNRQSCDTGTIITSLRGSSPLRTKKSGDNLEIRLRTDVGSRMGDDPFEVWKRARNDVSRWGGFLEVAG
jgi:hypothetical protein